MSAKRLLLSTAIIAMGAGIAAAEAQTQVAAASPSQVVSSSADQSAFETVTVTARRVSEDMEKVPQTVSVVSADDLSNRNVTDLTNLAQAVPSLTVTSTYRDSFIVAIRGQGGSSQGSSPSVATYFNEVPLPPTRANGAGGGGPGAFFDLESVQVLPGPQGTLFGRNTTGGAVLFTSKRPTDQFEGFFQAGYGDFNNREVSGVINIPVIDDTLLVRLGAQVRKQNGFTHSLGTPLHPNGMALDDVNYVTGRLSITYKPTSYLKNDIIVDWDNSTSSSPSTILMYAGAPATTLFPGIAQSVIDQKNLGTRVQLPTNSNQNSHKSTLAAIDILEYDISDQLTLKNIASYQHDTINQIIEADGSPYPVFSLQQTFVPFMVTAYTEELQLRGQAFDDRLNWTIGGFYYKAPLPSYLSSLYVFLGQQSRVTQRAGGDSEAVFGQASYKITDELTATAGIRETWDYQIAQSKSLSPAGACVTPTAITDSNCLTTRSGNFSGIGWTVSLDYQATPNTLYYVTSRHGYRTGGFNPTVPAANLFSFGPEFVTDVEVGTKSNWAITEDVSARTNISAYHQDYNSVQLQQVNIINATLQSYTANGGDAEVWGAEFEGWLYLLHGLQLNANFAWLDFHYTNFNSQVPIATVLAQESQDRPKYKFGLGARYQLPVDEKLGGIDIGADYTWMAKNGDASLPFGIRPAYGLLNLSANWNAILQSKISASFYMTNATNQVYQVGAYVMPSFGTTATVFGAPRMVGFRARYDF